MIDRDLLKNVGYLMIHEFEDDRLLGEEAMQHAQECAEREPEREQHAETLCDAGDYFKWLKRRAFDALWAVLNGNTVDLQHIARGDLEVVVCIKTPSHVGGQAYRLETAARDGQEAHAWCWIGRDEVDLIQASMGSGYRVFRDASGEVCSE